MTYASGAIENEALGGISKLVGAVRELQSRPDRQRLEQEYQHFMGLYRRGIVGLEAEVELMSLQREAANLPLPEDPFPDDFPSEAFVESLLNASRARRASQSSEGKAEQHYTTPEEPTPGTFDKLLQQNKLYLQEVAVYVHSRLPDDLGNNHSPEQFLHLALHAYENEERIGQKNREVIMDCVGDLVIQFNSSERGFHYTLEPDMLLSFYDFLQALEDPLQS